MGTEFLSSSGKKLPFLAFRKGKDIRIEIIKNHAGFTISGMFLQIVRWLWYFKTGSGYAVKALLIVERKGTITVRLENDRSGVCPPY